MLKEDIKGKIENIIEAARVRTDEPMSKHTTFRVGGIADVYVQIATKQELKELISVLAEADVPYYVVGNGSNLLVSDNGYHGVIIEIGSAMNAIEAEGTTLRAQAGVLLSTLAMTAYKNGLTGLEFAAGIPGTAGGAMVMNAGAYGGEMSMVVKSVEALDTESGDIVNITNAEMDFSYRHSIIRDSKYIVTEVLFDLEKGSETEIKAVMDDLAAKRKSKQPLEYPSAGSTFKRPVGFFAGSLIEESGLKGYAVGGAEVSEKHAGFIINSGGATATDVYCLIREVREKVYADSGVQLEPEVILLGDF